jgi:RNA polymerase sigma factor (sigma-70 family)
LSIVRWNEWNGWYEWGAAGAGGVLVLVLGVLAVRFLARNNGSLGSLGSLGGQAIDTSEPASNVQLRTAVDDHLLRSGVSDADKKDLAGYLLEQIRIEGLLPAPVAERSPQANARLAYQEKEARFLLAKAIDRLSQRELNVIMLQFYERLPAAELARVLAVSPSTVYRLRRSALRRLAETVGPAFSSR